MPNNVTIKVVIDRTSIRKFRKECERAALALTKLQEIRAEMLWECRQCGRANDYNCNTCKNCENVR